MNTSSMIPATTYQNCAACGKESDTLKACGGCNNTVKYCNAACQMAHRTQHKAECKKLFEVALFQIGKRAAELFDEILFKKPPPREDCPICMLQLPTPSNAIVYQACCGKLICSGCMLGIMCTKMGKIRCPFCRVECL